MASTEHFPALHGLPEHNNSLQQYKNYKNVSPENFLKNHKTSEKKRLKEEPPTQHEDRTIYQPDTLTSKLLMKKTRKLWRRALKKINNPNDDVS